jgi:hypothetical protein
MNNDTPRVGVYVCHCGSNIAGTVDVEDVANWAADLPNVVSSRDYKFMCSSLGQELIEKDIKEMGVNRVVVASCSPHLHEPTFRNACSRAGLNPYLFEMANIREQDSWVTSDKVQATEKPRPWWLRQSTVLLPAAARIAVRPHQPECPGRGRRRDRHPGCPGDRRQRLACLPGGARAFHRRAYGPVR